jgi:hypothetical protein
MRVIQVYFDRKFSPVLCLGGRRFKPEQPENFSQAATGIDLGIAELRLQTHGER